MSERLEPETDRLDEPVAKLTDHLLNQGLPDVEISAQDQELRGYQELLSRLSQTAQDTPDRQLVERVRSHLLQQWSISEQYPTPGVQRRMPVKSKTPSIYQSSRQRQNFTLRLAFAVIAVVAFAAFFIMPTINHAIPATAGGQADFVLYLIIIIILFFSFVVWWFFHRKG